MRGESSTLASTDSIHDDLAEDPVAIYRLHPLEANSIRVLQILPSQSADPSDIIRCRLSVTRLVSKPKYRAVSYVWGDASKTKVILVEDIPFRVRFNLWNFLAQMRAERYSDPLWIDAICINQDDLQERGAQVTIMGQIYSEAADVRAWLGTGDKRLVLAMQRLAETDWRAVEEAVESDDMFLYRQPYATNEWFAPICELFRLGYWTRLWVVQEYCLAKSLAVQYGFMVITSTMLQNLYLCMIGSKRSFSFTDDEQPAFESFFHLNSSPAWNILCTRRRMVAEPDGQNFRYLLHRFREAQCSDLHDYVYALLSFDGSALKAIVPDYSKSLLQLFLDVTAHLREQFERLQAEISLRESSLVLAVYTLRETLQLDQFCAEVREVKNWLYKLPYGDRDDYQWLEEHLG